MKAKISVLIIFFNEKHALKKTLRKLRQQNYPQELIEIVCVDDGSTDGSYDVARSFGTMLIRTEHKGISNARNIGIKHCTGEIILFIDAHLYLKKNVLKILNESFQRYPHISGVCGKYSSLSNQDKNYIRDIRRQIIFHKGRSKFFITLDSFTTFSIAIGAYKKDLFKKFKFPEGFENSYGEDTYFQIQLHNAGKILLYQPGIEGVHDALVDSKKIYQKMTYEIRGMGNILLAASKIDGRMTVPYLHYFLSFPLFLFLSILLLIINIKLFPLFLIFIFIEFKDLIKIFTAKNQNINSKIEISYYLVIKELLQGLYIPYYLIWEKRINMQQGLKIASYILGWELKKLLSLIFIKNIATFGKSRSL